MRAFSKITIESFTEMFVRCTFAHSDSVEKLTFPTSSSSGSLKFFSL